MYYLGIYSAGHPFDPKVVWKVLEILKKAYSAFFPAQLQIGRREFITLNGAEDFSYEALPKQYWVKKGVSVSIPLDGNNGSELTIYDDRESDLMPSSVVLNWTSASQLPPTEVLTDLMAQLVEKLSPTSALLTHKDTRLRPDIYARSFHLPSTLPDCMCWITWLAPTTLEKLPQDALKSLDSTVEVKSLRSGHLVILTQEPFDENDAAHRQTQQSVEDALGLTAIYAEVIK